MQRGWLKPAPCSISVSQRQSDTGRETETERPRDRDKRACLMSQPIFHNGVFVRVLARSRRAVQPPISAAHKATQQRGVDCRAPDPVRLPGDLRPRAPRGRAVRTSIGRVRPVASVKLRRRPLWWSRLVVALPRLRCSDGRSAVVNFGDESRSGRGDLLRTTHMSNIHGYLRANPTYKSCVDSIILGSRYYRAHGVHRRLPARRVERQRVSARPVLTAR